MDKDNEDVVYLLNTLLADEYLLYTKTRNANWNLCGPGFYELHKYFEIQYGLLDVMINDTAERVRSLGYIALGSLKEFLTVTHIHEENWDYNNSAQIIQSLILDHETIIQTIHNEINTICDKSKDHGIGDFVIGLTEQHEKMIWMLQTFLEVPDFSAISHIRNVVNHHV